MRDRQRGIRPQSWARWVAAAAIAAAGVTASALLATGVGAGRSTQKLTNLVTVASTCNATTPTFCISSPGGLTLRPGASPSSLPLTFSNYLNVPITVTTVTVAFTNSFTTPSGPCSASALQVGKIAASGTVPSVTLNLGNGSSAGVTVPAASGGVAGTNSFTTTLAFADSGAKQDACKNLPLTIKFTGSAQYKAQTQTLITFNPVQATWGLPVTLQATVSAGTPTQSASTPTGTITFVECPATGCTSTNRLVLNTVNTINGVATLSHTFYPFATATTAADVIMASFGPSDTTSWLGSSSTQLLTIGFSGCVTSSQSGLTVKSGQVECVTASGAVSGGINVQSGGGLVLEPGSHVSGGLVAKSGGIGTYICGSSVTGGENVSGEVGPVVVGNDTMVCSANTLAAGLSVTNNTDGVYVAANNTITGGSKVSGNNGTLPQP